MCGLELIQRLIIRSPTRSDSVHLERDLWRLSQLLEVLSGQCCSL